MKFGKWLQRAAAAAVAGCMMLSVSMPVLAETADALGEYSTQVQDVVAYDIWVSVGDSGEVQLDSSGPRTIGDAQFIYEPNEKELTVDEATPSAGLIAAPVAIRIEKDAGDVNVRFECPVNCTQTAPAVKVTGAHDVALKGGAYNSGTAAVVDCSGDVTSDVFSGDVVVKYARNVYFASGGWDPVVNGKVTINCSGIVEIENTYYGGMQLFNELNFTQSKGRDCVYWYLSEKTDEMGEGTPTGAALKIETGTGMQYLKIVPQDDGTDDTVDDAAAPAGDGSAVVGAVLGAAAVWGGYEVAARAILNRLLPEGAAIPSNRGQLALLAWNTAGQPEPANAPAFADIEDAELAKAAQWAIEQGLMDEKADNAFKPNARVTKLRVCRTWKDAVNKGLLH